MYNKFTVRAPGFDQRRAAGAPGGRAISPHRGVRSDVVVIYVRDLGLTITQGAPRRLAGTARLYELQLFSE